MRSALLAGLATLMIVAPACARDATPEAGGGEDAAGILFVTNKGEDTVSRISLADGEETQRSASCANPHELALSPDQAHVALGCYGGSAVEIFRAADLTRIGTVELGENARPHGLVWHESGTLIATGQGRGSVFVVRDPLSDTPQVTEIPALDGGPHMIAVSADAATAWGAAVDSGEVARIDLAAGEVTHRRALGGNTEAVALSPDGSALWVGANTADKVWRLDPATLEPQAEIATGRFPIRIAVHPGGAWAVTSNLRDGSLSVIDTSDNTLARTIAVSGEAGAGQVTLIFSPDGERLYLAETGANMVAEIDFASGEVLRRMPAGEAGDGLAVTR